MILSMRNVVSERAGRGSPRLALKHTAYILRLSSYSSLHALGIGDA